MAIKLEDKTNVDAPDAAYPFGKIRDNNGSGNGTPVNSQVYGDFHQFFAKMLAESGVTVNGLAENQTNGFQYFEALLRNISQRITTRIGTNLNNEINPGIFSINGSYTNRPTGFDSGSGTTGQLLITKEGNNLTQRVIQFNTGAEWLRTSSNNGSSWIAYTVIRYAIKKIDIGIWNMDADDSKSLTTSDGLLPKYFDAISIEAWIFEDQTTPDPAYQQPINLQHYASFDLTPQGYVTRGTSALGQIALYRKTGGVFDDTDFNSTSINRGYVVFTYNPDSVLSFI